MNFTLKAALAWAVNELHRISPTACLDAEVLLSYVLKQPTTFLLAHDDSTLSFLKWFKFKRLIQKRKQGIPVAYLTGYKEFYFLDFKVTSDVLVPRPDTEVLVECVIDYINSKLKIKNYELNNFLLIDVGTGSGCIPISVLKNIQGLSAIATDVSSRALRVARANAKKHGVRDRLHFYKSDLFKKIPKKLFEHQRVLMTANLPYVPNKNPVAPGVKFEPKVAVYGGDDGLDLYRRLFKELEAVQPEVVFLECLDFQIPVIAEFSKQYHLQDVKKMFGTARMVMMERV